MSLRDLTIFWRMQFAGIAILGLTLVMATLAAVSYRDISHRHDIALTVQGTATNLQLMLRGLNESAFTQGASASVQSARDGIARFNEAYTQLLGDTENDAKMHAFLAGDWATAWRNLQPRVEKFLDESEDVDFNNIKQMIEIGKLVSQAGKLADEMMVFAKEIREISADHERTAMQRLGGFVAGLVIATLIIFYLLFRSVAHPVRELQAFIVDVERHSDLTRRAPTDAKDELSNIGLALNTMLGKFQGILQNVAGSMERLTEETQELRQVSDTTSRGVAAQKESTVHLASAMNEMASSVTDVSQTIQRTASGMDNAKAETDKSQGVVASAARAINALAASVQQSGQVVKALHDKAESIGTVLDVIRGIADQTNLLALNAAIEAARAGEQGRGFAVVADEVRTLANRTQTSTKEIQNIIQQLQSGANDAVRVMEEGRNQAEASVHETEQAIASLAAVTSSVNAVAELSTQIAAATEEQSAAAEAISRDVSTIREVAEQTASGAQETAEVSQSIETLARNLQSSVKSFKVG